MTYSLTNKKAPSYNTYKIRAIKNFPSEEMISEHEFNLMSVMDCYYCGVKGSKGIDRQDNNKGYTKANCVPCCVQCNNVKGDLSMQEFTEWKNRFIKHQNNQMNLK